MCQIFRKKNLYYDDTFVYKIYCLDKQITDIYVGSTKNFKQRQNSHKKMCIDPRNKDKRSKAQNFIVNNGGWSNFNMIILEEQTNSSADLLRCRERYYIDLLKPSLNINKPSPIILPLIEYKGNKEIYLKEKEERAKKRDKIYRELNKEQVKNRGKIWRELNKEKINLYYAEKIECNICKKIITRGYLSKHNKNIHKKLNIINDLQNT